MAFELDRLECIEIDLALRALNAAAAYHLDHGEIAEFAALFTDDALYTHGERRSEGRAAIEALLKQRTAAGPRTSRHIQSGLRFEIQTPTSARGASVCLAFAANGLPPLPATPFLVADFFDRYARGGDGRWRIAERRIERVFVGPANPGPVGQTAAGAGASDER